MRERSTTTLLSLLSLFFSYQQHDYSPTLTTGQLFLHSWRHFFGLHLDLGGGKLFDGGREMRKGKEEEVEKRGWRTSKEPLPSDRKPPPPATTTATTQKKHRFLSRLYLSQLNAPVSGHDGHARQHLLIVALGARGLGRHREEEKRKKTKAIANESTCFPSPLKKGERCFTAAAAVDAARSGSRA